MTIFNCLNILAMYPQLWCFSPTQNTPINRQEKQKHSGSSSFLKFSLWKIHLKITSSPEPENNTENMLLMHFLPSFLSFFYEQVLHFFPLVLHSSSLWIRWVYKKQEITARIPTSKTTTKSQSIETKVHLGVLPEQAVAA